ncbi:lysine exporter LysO family protein [Sedimentibacter sp. B4]|uniref:lysine exporter LysO family protein n=1 Tax=Sedimentibacter sp. B4 TaxID=304766 RepID=UPI0002FD372A|nr:lysine exporter LysO family protein [Sedimentibacter sp. B4]
MIFMPFICLGIGLLLGLRHLSQKMLSIADKVINVALVLLMLTIGLNIGINDSVMLNLHSIGFNCLIISLCAIFFSVLFTVIVEKTLLPLEKLKNRICAENVNISDEINISDEEVKSGSILVWIMPASIVSGVIIGYFLFPDNLIYVLDYLLTGSLIILYMSVGLSLGCNINVFKYIKILGFRVVYISIAILIGSITGGAISGIVLKLPPHISIISASGMSYYSLTGAYMTQVYGIETGTYGFIVNVMREFFTVLLLPFLIKISTGSPIAGGAAGNMDTMLVPVTKFVGVEIGLVTLITGVILTFTVPFMLPILCEIF